MTSYIDPKQMVNVLRIPLADLHNIDIFKRSNLVLEFKSDGVYLKKYNEPSNSIYLRTQNLREYIYKAIRKLITNNECIVVDYNFINTYVQIIKKLKISELSLYMDNKIKHSNGIKLHLIADCENLLMTFGRKCNYDTNLEAEYINIKNNEPSNYKTDKKVVEFEPFGCSYEAQEIINEDMPIKENDVGQYQPRRVKKESLPASALCISKDQVKDFKLQPSNKKQIVEEKDYAIKDENFKPIKDETSHRKNFMFFQSLKEKSMSNTFEYDDRRGNQDYNSNLKHLRCNR